MGHRTPNSFPGSEKPGIQEKGPGSENSDTYRRQALALRTLTHTGEQWHYQFKHCSWSDPGGGVQGVRTPPPPCGPRYSLFNIGPKVGPPSWTPFFACRPKMDPLSDPLLFFLMYTASHLGFIKLILPFLRKTWRGYFLILEHKVCL